MRLCAGSDSTLSLLCLPSHVPGSQSCSAKLVAVGTALSPTGPARVTFGFLCSWGVSDTGKVRKSRFTRKSLELRLNRMKFEGKCFNGRLGNVFCWWHFIRPWKSFPKQYWSLVPLKMPA